MHIEAVRAVDTTRRTDPTIVFLPEIHEASVQRARRRKRLLAIAAAVLVLIAAGSITFTVLNRRWREVEQATARRQMARRELNMLADGLERFRLDMGRYPSDSEGLAALTRKTAASKAVDSEAPIVWMGPYVDGVYEVDPWGNDYVYRVTNDGESFELFSYGPDGEGARPRD